MSKQSWVWWVVLALGCSSPDNSGQQRDLTQEPREFTCFDDAGCPGVQTCEGNSCSECLCKATMETCQTANGCDGVQRCSASGCEACVCSAPATAPEPAWKADFTGSPLELKAGVDGSVVVRFAEDPWLVRFAGDDGQATPLSLQAGLGWVNSFIVAPDGSLYLGGTTAISGSQVRIDHVSANGELLASSMPSADLVQLDALGLGPDGKVYLVADSTDGRKLVALNEDGSQESALPIEVDARFDSGDYWYLDTAKRLAFSEDGSFLLQGGADILWVQQLEVTAEAARTRWVRQLADNVARDSVFAGGVFPTADGGALVGVGTGWTNASSLLGYYNRNVKRLAADGRITWSAGDYFTPGVPEPQVIRHSSICPLTDSVLLATRRSADPRLGSDSVLLDPAAPTATVARYTMAGAFAQSLVLPGVLDVVSVGPTSAVFLSATQLTRFDLPALEVTAGAAGAACSANSDCASGACCASPSKAFKSECGAEAHCAQGDLCVDDAGCNGKCLKGAMAGSQGFCSQLCGASSECPKGSFCAEGSCLAACASPAECPYVGAACTTVSNAESVMVTACKPQ